MDESIKAVMESFEKSMESLAESVKSEIDYRLRLAEATTAYEGRVGSLRAECATNGAYKNDEARKGALSHSLSYDKEALELASEVARVDADCRLASLNSELSRFNLKFLTNLLLALKG